eukprot:jgi/Psemu1/321464/estExt_fgenesh1_pg.C_20091
MIRQFAVLFLWYCCSHSRSMSGNQVNRHTIFAQAHPYMILSNTRSKCFSVIAPHDQVISIEYDAPDLVLPQESMVDATDRARREAGVEEGMDMDSQWNQKMRERLDRIKSKKLRDTSVTVTQRGSLLSATHNKQSTSYDEAGNLVTTGSGRIREELAQPKGRIDFLTGKDAGTVEVCVQSILASPKKPARFYLKVETAASDNEYDDDDGYYDDDSHISETGTKKDPDHLEHRELSSKMTRLERDLQTLQNRVRACLNNADFNKDQETIFHEQSVSMNRATKYWPMIQLTVLIVTGFTQANHIVRYLKTHHIGL